MRCARCGNENPEGNRFLRHVRRYSAVRARRRGCVCAGASCRHAVDDSSLADAIRSRAAADSASSSKFGVQRRARHQRAVVFGIERSPSPQAGEFEHRSAFRSEFQQS